MRRAGPMARPFRSSASSFSLSLLQSPMQPASVSSSLTTFPRCLEIPSCSLDFLSRTNTPVVPPPPSGRTRFLLQNSKTSRKTSQSERRFVSVRSNGGPFENEFLYPRRGSPPLPSSLVPIITFLGFGGSVSESTSFVYRSLVRSLTLLFPRNGVLEKWMLAFG